MAGPFSDLLVVEMGRFVSVPFCAQMLADGGARVVKIEPLEGDPYRSNHPIANRMSRQFIIKNRGKESLPLDFNDEDGRAVLDALLLRADVFLVNLSPKAVKRKQLDYESVAKLNSRLIYGSVSGFGRRGPDAELAGMDVVAQARSGLLTSLGAESEGVPLHSEVQAADYATSILLFSGVVSALYVRERSGCGQEVSVSLLGGALALQNNSIVHLEEHDHWREEFVTVGLPQVRREGGTPREMNALRDSMRIDANRNTRHYRVFRASDGFVAVGAGSPATRSALRELLADGIDTPLDELPIEEIFSTQTVSHWVSELRACDIPATSVHHIDEMVFDDHVLAEGLIVRIEDPDVGGVRVLTTPISLSETRFTTASPAPRFGEQAEDILSGLGFESDRIRDLFNRGVISRSTSETT